MYVDLSNIVIGSQLLPGGRKDFSARVQTRALTQLVLDLRSCASGLVVGSRPPPGHRLWETWRSEKNFTVRNLTPVIAPDGRRHEETVDDVIHAAILRDVTKFGRHPTPRTLVILTGDGNSNGGHTSFPEVIEQALSVGFNVEVWCWKGSASAVYTRFRLSIERASFSTR